MIYFRGDIFFETKMDPSMTLGTDFDLHCSLLKSNSAWLDVVSHLIYWGGGKILPPL